MHHLIWAELKTNHYTSPGDLDEHHSELLSKLR